MYFSKNSSVAVFTTSLFVTGCAFNPYQLDDPSQFLGHGPIASEVIKSMRCEIVTFLLENKLRSAFNLKQQDIMKTAERQKNKPAFDMAVSLQKDYPFIAIDSTQYAALTVDLKNVDTVTLSLGYDWKKPSSDPKGSTPTLGELLRSQDSKDFHLGPSYSETNTFEMIETLGLPQNADLGPSKDFSTRNLQSKPPGNAQFNAGTLSSAYFGQPIQDASFFCFGTLKKLAPHNEFEVMQNIQSLVVGDAISKELENFRRIYVGINGITLARWLQKTSADIVVNQNSIYPNAENILAGQLEYSFTLDVKPGFDMKYTLIASTTNPLVPDMSGAIEHSGQFSIYLNTPYSLTDFGAKQGNSCNPQLDYSVAHKLSPFNSSCKPPTDSKKK